MLVEELAEGRSDGTLIRGDANPTLWPASLSAVWCHSPGVIEQPHHRRFQALISNRSTTIATASSVAPSLFPRPTHMLWPHPDRESRTAGHRGSAAHSRRCVCHVACWVILAGIVTKKLIGVVPTTDGIQRR